MASASKRNRSGRRGKIRLGVGILKKGTGRRGLPLGMAELESESLFLEARAGGCGWFLVGIAHVLATQWSRDGWLL
jgi:hypothetical protein